MASPSTSSSSDSSSSDIADLNARFAISGSAQIVAGKGGLPKVQLFSSGASADIYLHGAQVTSWKLAGQEDALFLSELSRWEDGRAIRGGVPVCFPWFRGKADNAKAPAHGFARTQSWNLVSVAQDEESDAIAAVLSLENNEISERWWPHPFHLELKISVGSALGLELTVTNTGEAPFSFEEALHTYYRVGDVESVRIKGLEQTSFLDNTDGNREKVETGEIALTRATDNAFQKTAAPVTLGDPVLKRSIRLEKQHSNTTVVWNPWKDGAAALADLGDDEWQQMACVEACNIMGQAVTLQAGERHTLNATISIT